MNNFVIFLIMVRPETFEVDEAGYFFGRNT